MCFCELSYRDVGIYIASIDPEGIAAKSGKLQVLDRILACNGCDFTKGMSNTRVEEIVTDMLKAPLLKMAVGRGGFKGILQTPNQKESGAEVGGMAVPEEVGMAVVGGVNVSSGGGDVEMRREGEGGGEEQREVDQPEAATPTRPTIKTVGKSWAGLHINALELI